METKTSISLVISHDPDPTSPRAYDPVGTIADWKYSRYWFGDIHYETPLDLFEGLVTDAGAWGDSKVDIDEESNMDEYYDDVLRVVREHYIILPVYAYVHSGMTISTSPFSCPWDSGQAGFIYVKKGTMGLDDEVLKDILEYEIKDLAWHLEGLVWGYQVFQDDDLVDSCWGFAGDTLEETGIMDHLVDGSLGGITQKMVEDAWVDRT